jgi:hypothetical protein
VTTDNPKNLNEENRTMESTQNTRTETAKFEVEISIGLVNIFAIARDSLNILSVPHSSPWVMLTLTLQHGRWIATTSSPGYLIGSKKTPAPAGLMAELVTVGGNWAIAHPEEFERAGIEEYDNLIESCCEGLDRLLEELQETENDLRQLIAEPEVVRQAPAMLRSRLEDAEKMVHAMRLQTEAADEAISDAAYEESDEGEQH